MTCALRLRVPEAAPMEALGAALAAASRGAGGVRIYLRGELGTGKTTLVRGYLRAVGHQGAVRSPTYTLIEPYPLPAGDVFHLDLYRLAASEELEYLGLRDLERPDSTLLVEWPQQGHGALPPPDLEIALEYADSQRRVSLQSRTMKGEELLQRLHVPAACERLD